MAAGYDIGASISPSASLSTNFNSPFFVTGGGQGAASKASILPWVLAGVAAIAIVALVLLFKRKA